MRTAANNHAAEVRQLKQALEATKKKPSDCESKCKTLEDKLKAVEKELQKLKAVHAKCSSSSGGRKGSAVGLPSPLGQPPLTHGSPFASSQQPQSPVHSSDEMEVDANPSTNVTALTQALEKCESDLRAQKEKANSAQAGMDRYGRTVENLSEKIKATQNALKENEQKITNGQAELNEKDQLLKNGQALMNEKDQQLKRGQEQLSALEAKRDALLQEGTKWKELAESQAEELKTANAAVEQANAALQEATAAKEKAEQELEKAKGEAKNVRDELFSARQVAGSQLQEKEAQLAELQNANNQLAAERSALQKAHQDCEQKRKDAAEREQDLLKSQTDVMNKYNSLSSSKAELAKLHGQCEQKQEEALKQTEKTHKDALKAVEDKQKDVLKMAEQKQRDAIVEAAELETRGKDLEQKISKLTESVLAKMECNISEHSNLVEAEKNCQEANADLQLKYKDAIDANVELKKATPTPNLPIHNKDQPASCNIPEHQSPIESLAAVRKELTTQAQKSSSAAASSLSGFTSKLTEREAAHKAAIEQMQNLNGIAREGDEDRIRQLLKEIEQMEAAGFGVKEAKKAKKTKETKQATSADCTVPEHQQLKDQLRQAAKMSARMLGSIRTFETNVGGLVNEGCDGLRASKATKEDEDEEL
jgi:chromosome segregation ATPase